MAGKIYRYYLVEECLDTCTQKKHLKDDDPRRVINRTDDAAEAIELHIVAGDKDHFIWITEPDKETL